MTFAKMTDYLPRMLALRHELHMNPETAYEETRTAATLITELERLCIEYSTGLAGTGIVATLRGTAGTGRTIGLRADMDALNIQEIAGRHHGSKVPGKMHACGHDGHMAMLMGAASYLSDHRDFEGTVHFIFQPAEEGFAGGQRMVEEGLFEKFPVDAVYGMHNMPGLAAGRFQTRTGPFLAASDTWTVTFQGTGGHGGAGAHTGTDPTLALAQFLIALQTIVSRSVAPSDMAVVSVGHITGGTAAASSIIPSEVTVRGTARSFTPEIRDTIERRIREIAEGQAAAFNCKAEIDYVRLYPPLVTTDAETLVAVNAASATVGKQAVESAIEPLTISEDFAFMLEACCGGFVLIGNGLADEGFSQLHTASYDFNDDILPIGAAFWVELVHAELARSQ